MLVSNEISSIINNKCNIIFIANAKSILQALTISEKYTYTTTFTREQILGRRF